MEFLILGPLQVWGQGRRLRLGGPRQERTLAMLLLPPNHLVTPDLLAEALWDGEPPATARRQVQNSISAMRQVLVSAGSPGVLTADPPGYLLRVAPGALDTELFEGRLAAGHRLAAAGQLAAAAGQLRSALDLWRGNALADLSGRWIEAAAAQLNERRLQTVEECVEWELRLGRFDELAGELPGLVLRSPLRERLVGQLMRALHGAGRQADALAAYQGLRRRMVEELGVEPGPALRRLHQAVLSNELPVALRPPATSSQPVRRDGRLPAQLPGNVADFTGRVADLARLDDMLGDGLVSAAALIVAVVGTAGVGKTALAVHWARRVAAQFPDGQLFVNLRGHSPGEPMKPIDALAQLLRGLGLDPREVPVDVEEAAGLYRTVVSRRRLLVVLDNAVSAEQVRPLLPGNSECLTLITSRDHLGGLAAREGARRLRLDVLTPAEATALLIRIIGAERAQAETAATEAVARLCAHLPLALRIASANLAGRPHQTVTGYAAQLADENSLAALAAEGDQQTAVRAAFDLSYERLTPAARSLFRLLGSPLGADVSLAAAVALSGRPHEEVTLLLDQLSSAHLIEEHAPGRFRTHDLLRLYARNRARHEDGEARWHSAESRLLTWYLEGTDAAARLLYPQMLRLPAASQRHGFFADQRTAMTWLETERSNLVTAVAYAAGSPEPDPAWRLADALRGYFALRHDTREWLAAAEIAAAAARAAGDDAALAAAHLSLAHAHWSIRQYSDAIEHNTRSLELAERCGWTEAQATNLGNLGLAYREIGRLDDAADYCERALRLDRATGRRAGQANNLANLGFLYREMGRPGDATQQCTEALQVFRELGSVGGQAHAQNNLGCVWHALGDWAQAGVHLRSALDLYRQIGDRSNEADTLSRLAEVMRDADHPQAPELAREALALSREIGDRRAEADTLNVLATIDLRGGRAGRAREGHHEALALATKTGTRYQQTEALIGLAGAYHALGDIAAASRCSSEALQLARGSGHRILADRAAATVADSKTA